MGMGSARELADWLKNMDDVMVITHFRPDGDAYGTALAVTMTLTALGKRAFTACDDAIGDKYAFLPGSSLWHTGGHIPFTPQCALGVDVSDEARMGDLRAAFERAPNRAVLDHHATNTGFGDVCYIDETAASAGEMALTLMDALGVAMTEPIAVCLFTAISTDCGNFSFANTTARSYRAAARCVDGGANPEKLTRALYRLRSIAKTKLLGAALSRVELYYDGRVAVIRLPLALFREMDATPEDAHGIVNYLSEMAGVRVGILAEEQAGGVKFSFRASDDVNVAALAQEFGGGGHVLAAGANMKDVSLADACARVIDAARKYGIDTVR